MCSKTDSPMRESEGWQSQNISEVARLRNENAELQSRLDRSLASLMRLQGGAEHITGGDIKKRFEKLYSAIQDWVAEIELDLLRHSRNFREAFHEIVLSENHHKLLLDLGIRERDKAKSVNSTWDRNSRDFAKINWLGQLDTSINVVLSRLIWCRLYSDIFKVNYPLGLHNSVTKGLDYVIEAIGGDSDGKPTQESILRANKWRSEAMVALVSTKMVKTDKASQMQNVRRRLLEELSQKPISLDSEILKRHFPALEVSVLIPAAELQQFIACSPIEYDITESDDFRLQVSAEEGRLQGCTLKDIVKWRDTDPSQAFSGVFCSLFPGIDQVGMEEKGYLPLVKPILLVFDSEASHQIHELAQTQDFKQSKTQRSPTRGDRSLQPSSPAISSRPSTTKHLQNPQHASQPGKREDTRSEARSSGGRWARFASNFGASGVFGESPNQNRRSQFDHHGSGDKSYKKLPPREQNEKAKRLRRTKTAPATTNPTHKSGSSSPTSFTSPSISGEPSAYPQSQKIPVQSCKIAAGVDVPPKDTSVSRSSIGHRAHFTRSHSEDECADDLMEVQSRLQMKGDNLEEFITVEQDGAPIPHFGVAMSNVSRTSGMDPNVLEQFSLEQSFHN